MTPMASMPGGGGMLERISGGGRGNGPTLVLWQVDFRVNEAPKRALSLLQELNS
jgi:hypothetical protein